MLVLFLVFLLLAKNIVRTRTGRALQAIRDRDIAAEVMGVPEFRYKLIAFAASSHGSCFSMFFMSWAFVSPDRLL